MVYTKKSRKRKRPTGRSFYRRKRRKFRTTNNPMAKLRATPLGRSFKLRTRYVDKNIQLNASSGGIPANHVFSLNGCYDPDVTGIGHQPLGFDQVMPLYDHYTVIGAKAFVTFSNTDTSYDQLVVLQIKDTNTTSTTTNEVLENGLCKYATLGTHGSGQSVKTLVIGCSPKKFFGRKVMQGDKYQGNASNNPSDQVFLHIQAGPLEAVDADIVDVTVRIEYIIVFTEPKQLGQS